MIKLRDYQDYAVESVFDYFSRLSGNPLIVMPTGTGKSLVIAGFIQRAWMSYPGQRIVVATHVKELISQNFKKLMELWPLAPAGIYSAGLNRRDIKPITFVGIASVSDIPEAFGHVDIIIIDEAHLLSPKEGTRYQVFINALRRVNPYLKVVGLTATHYRMGQGLLTEEDGLFTDVCVDMATRDAFTWFIDEGYLSTLIPKRTLFELDITGVKVQQGDYNQKQLQEAVDKSTITRAALAETLQAAEDRNHWLVFSSGIEHAMHIAQMLNDEFHVPATYVHSKMPEKERDRNILEFTQGKYRAMVNNGILTTGFDYPEIDLISVLRPTKSTSLWVQMLGRGTRPVYEGSFDLSTREGRLASIACGPKQNCLVLDFARNTPRLGPVNDPVLPRRKGKKGGGEAPIKICEVCGTYNHSSVRFCSSCGNEFPRAVAITAQTSTEELVTRTPVVQFETFAVNGVEYDVYTSKAGNRCLRVKYYCGLRTFTHSHLFELQGLPRKRAREWWRNCAGSTPPETVDEAKMRFRELRAPKSIEVFIRPDYPEVVGYAY